MAYHWSQDLRPLRVTTATIRSALASYLATDQGCLLNGMRSLERYKHVDVCLNVIGIPENKHLCGGFFMYCLHCFDIVVYLEGDLKWFNL